jgi:hypothetical protein
MNECAYTQLFASGSFVIRQFVFTAILFNPSQTFIGHLSFTPSLFILVALSQADHSANA